MGLFDPPCFCPQETETLLDFLLQSDATFMQEIAVVSGETADRDPEADAEAAQRGVSSSWTSGLLSPDDPLLFPIVASKARKVQDTLAALRGNGLLGQEEKGEDEGAVVDGAGEGVVGPQSVRRGTGTTESPRKHSSLS